MPNAGFQASLHSTFRFPHPWVVAEINLYLFDSPLCRRLLLLPKKLLQSAPRNAAALQSPLPPLLSLLLQSLNPARLVAVAVLASLNK
jgi:hypothetical protein